MQVLAHYKPIKESKEVTFFFSGFPGLFTQNEDLAEFLCATKDTHCVLLRLPGLGTDLSSFSLIKSIKAATEYCLKVNTSGEFEVINFVGHSWGGLVALNILKLDPSIKPKRLLLLSPATVIPKFEEVLIVVKEYAEIRKLVGAQFDERSILEELKSHGDSFSPILSTDFYKHYGSTIKIIQALNDTTVPTELNRSFSSIVQTQSYSELEDNHWFTNRMQLFKEVLKVW